MTTSRMESVMESMPKAPDKWALRSLALAMLLSSTGVSIPNVALPTLAREFSATFPEVQWIILIYLLALTIMIVTAGRLGDLYGRRKVLLIGIFLFTFAAFLCCLSPTLGMLIGTRAIQGLGAAVVMALTMASVQETVSKDKVGSAMGLMGTMSAVGTASGPSIGGLVISGFGWRGTFLVMVILGLTSFYMCFRFLPIRKQNDESERPGFDILGTTLLGATLAAYAFGVTLGGGHFSEMNWVLLAIAFFGFGFFLFTEVRAASPLIRLEVFRNRGISSSLVMNVIVATVMMSTLVVGPFYLSRALGLDARLVGIVMSVGPLMSILTGFPSGRIVDRFGASLVAIIGLAEMTLGVSALVFLPTLFGLLGYVLSVAILSPGYQLFQAANSTAVMADIASEERGVISGLLNLSRNLGLITGASVMGVVFSHSTEAAQLSAVSSHSVAIGMKATFSVALCLISIALIIAIFFQHIFHKKGKEMRSNSLDKFTSEVKKVFGPLTSETVSSCQQLLGDLAKAPISEEWLANLLGKPDVDVELYRDSELGFLLLAHAEIKGLYRVPHDHGSGWVIYAVQSGEMEMRTYKPIIDQKGKMNLVCRESYRVYPGDCKVYLPQDIHDTKCISSSVLMLRLTSCDLKRENREGRMVRYID